jgi:Rod binding domain-containing protein
MTGLPPIASAALPADVRTGSAEHRKQYEAALGLESSFLQTLTKTLADSTKSGDDEEGADAATNTYRQMLPQTLSDALISAGGIGLARQIVPAAKDAS